MYRLYSVQKKRGRPAKNVSKNDLKEENVKKIETNIHEPKRQRVIGNGKNASPQPIAKNKAECAFCHSARITENTGPMLHFAGGKPLDDKYASHPKAVHAHQNCIEWAPKAYFEGDVAMNLTAEVARAGKLRCSYCGLKGAALGCFAKKCRKCFHMPCAMEIPECRWDFDNYHFLCSVHSSHELPCDASRTLGKSNFNSSSTVERAASNHTLRHLSSKLKVEADESSAASPNVAKGWVLSESFLSSEDKDIFHKFATLIGADVAKSWNENVTHIVASTDERGACTRTLKVLMGILTGKWILKIDWITACLEAGHPVPEEPYEITCDVHGCSNGPKNGRLRAMNKAPKLLTGLSFHLMGYFMPYYKSYLEGLVATGGGVILNKIDLLNLERSTSQGLSKTFVVYNAEPPQGCNAEDLAGIIKKRAAEAEALASKIGARAVDHTWLLDCIAASNLRM